MRRHREEPINRVVTSDIINVLLIFVAETFSSSCSDVGEPGIISILLGFLFASKANRITNDQHAYLLARIKSFMVISLILE